MSSADDDVMVWCATFSERVRHAHEPPSAVRRHVHTIHWHRVCTPILASGALFVSDPEWWRTIGRPDQPRARCLRCVATIAERGGKEP